MGSKTIPNFDHMPTKWIKFINSVDAILGPTTWHKIIELEEEAQTNSVNDEDFHCVLFALVVDK